MMDEQLPELPRGWVWTKIGEIVQVIRGASPRPKGDPRYFGGNIPWIRISDISKEKSKYISKTRDTVTIEGAKRSRYLKAGTLILSNSGTVCVPKILAVDGCIHDGFVAFPDLTKDIDILFLYYFFDYIRPSVIQENRQGVTQINLNTSIVKEISVSLPPFPEQQHIVAKIEELFTELDAGMEVLKKVKTQLKRYRQAVLKYAFEGKLTEEWREIHREELESASVLLERIKEERRKKWEEAELSKMKRNDKIPGDERWKNAYKNPLKLNNQLDIKLPRGWNWTNLDTLTYFTIDYRGKTPPTVKKGIPIISAANVKNGKILTDKPRFVSQETYDKWTTRGLPEQGDLIITTEAPVGEAALYPYGETYLLTRRVLACQTLGVMNHYLLYFFYSELTRKYLDKQSRGTTVPRILKPILLSIPISLPPLLEQRKIVEEIEQRFSVAGEIEKTVEDVIKQAERLRQSILKKAFEGKLVPQNPDDEPAHLLLERIKAEKAKKESKRNQKDTNKRG